MRPAPRGRGRLARLTGRVVIEPSKHAPNQIVAARAAEIEHVALRQVDGLRQRFPQSALGAETPAADSRFRQAETRRGLLDAELLDRAQHEDGAETLRQLIGVALQDLAHLLALDEAIRLERRRRWLARHLNSLTFPDLG